MIDEHDLRALLAEAADAAPPPGRAPEELVAALRDERTSTTPVPLPRFRAGRREILLAAAAVVAVLGLLRALPGDQLPGPSWDTSAGDEEVTPAADFDVAQGGATSGGLANYDDFGAFGTGGTGGTGGTDGGSVAPVYSTPVPGVPSMSPASAEVPYVQAVSGSAAAPEVPVQATDGAKVVKTGSLVLELEEGAYGGTVDRITTTAIGLGGYVADSTTNRSEDALSGTITVRVPADRFDEFLSGLRELGTVESEGVRGADVTAQHTDLQARLASVTATRERLQSVLAEASNIGDIIMIQDRITGVQTEIEQLQGQLRLLDDQVAMGTLSVSLAEPGADQVAPSAAAKDDGLGDAWDDARRSFGNGVESVVEWSGTGAVALIFAAVLWVVGRFGWRRVRRHLL